MLDLLREERTQEEITLHRIKIDGGTQMRASLNLDTVAEYEAAINEGARFPPIVVFYDGNEYWLGDGFHRVEAYRRVHAALRTLGSVIADVRSGTRRDAVLFAAGANADHGLRRTSADKRRAVETLLRDDEWAQWSNREIARRCRVDEKTVRTVRAELTAENPQLEATERRYTDRHGNEQVMQTAKIGAARLAPNGEPPDEAAKLDRELASLSRWLIDRGWAIGYAPMPQTCYVEKGTIRFAFANREAKASELAALRNAKAHEEHANLDRATDDAVADAWESPPLMWCPRCHAEYEDHDGLGVLHCVACGYCTHPAATGDICDLCGADLRSATNGATEITDLAKRLVRSVDDIDGAKRFLKTDHLTIIERAASYTRLVAKALLELADKEP